jgi:hypothetical protein
MLIACHFCSIRFWKTINPCFGSLSKNTQLFNEISFIEIYNLTLNVLQEAERMKKKHVHTIQIQGKPSMPSMATSSIRNAETTIRQGIRSQIIILLEWYIRNLP